MDIFRELCGWVMFSSSLGILAVRYATRWTPEAKRKAATVLSVPLGVAGIPYTWLQPWRDRGPNVYHIIVYVAFGIGVLTLIDYVVDRYRARGGSAVEK